jgi:hypothetical protein
MSKRIHVVPHDSGWATRREGASRAGSTHHTQAEVVIHRPNGRIRDANSYGNDPFPPKG